MILQIYNFALIINKRRDSIPGATFPIQVFFAYITMHIYFLRTGHRERMSTVQVGRVCPGGIFCSEEMHALLVVFDLLVPYFVGHLTLPLVVRARVQYVYAHLVDTDEAEEGGEGSQGAKPAKTSKKKVAN